MEEIKRREYKNIPAINPQIGQDYFNRALYLIKDAPEYFYSITHSWFNISAMKDDIGFVYKTFL